MADSEETINKVMTQFGISRNEAKGLLQSQNELQELTEECSATVREEERKLKESLKSEYDERNKLIESIPNFWATVFWNHPLLGDYFTKQDQKIFEYLSSLEVKDDKSEYSFIFNFKENNPYFSTRQIVKTYTINGDISFVTPIDWKKRRVPRGVSHGKKKKQKVTNASFFTWFSMDNDDEFAEIIKDDIWQNPFKYLDDEDPLKQNSEDESDEED